MQKFRNSVACKTILSFMEYAAYFAASEEIGYKIMSGMLGDAGNLSAASFPFWINAVLAFTKPRCKFALQAMEMLFMLFSQAPYLLGDLKSQSIDEQSQSPLEKEGKHFID